MIILWNDELYLYIAACDLYLKLLSSQYDNMYIIRNYTH
jgi:hypothetical protein